MVIRVWGLEGFGVLGGFIQGSGLRFLGFSSRAVRGFLHFLLYIAAPPPFFEKHTTRQQKIASYRGNQNNSSGTQRTLNPKPQPYTLNPTPINNRSNDETKRPKLKQSKIDAKFCKLGLGIIVPLK